MAIISEMLTATLGGLIKDFRLKKRLSQQEVSLRIGWKDTTRLSKIEQGRVGKPTLPTIKKVIKALDLDERDTGEFLLTGGYLPTEEEVKDRLKELVKKVEDWPYPAYINDFGWRFLYSNGKNLDVFNLDIKWQARLLKEKPSLLLFPFLPKDVMPVQVFKGEDAANLKPFVMAQVATFKMETFLYQYETWYKKTVQSLMSYPEFISAWATVTENDYHKKLLDYEYKRIQGIYNKQELTLNFHVTVARLIKDPRFQVVFYYPADKATAEFKYKH